MSVERCEGCNRYIDTDFEVGCYTDGLKFYCDNCMLEVEECWDAEEN